MEIPQNSIDFSVLLTIASVGVIVLVLFVIVLVLKHQRRIMEHGKLLGEKEKIHQRQLLNASLEIAEQERAKTAANIHDDIGMMLHVIKLNISKASRNLNDPKLSAEALKESNSLVEKTIDSIRILFNDLMPPALTNLGFMEGMIELCNDVNGLGVITLELKTEIGHIDMDKKNALHLYRLIKEVMNNIVKHAKASDVEIDISTSQGSLLVVVMHNGKGITNEAIQRLIRSGKGIGLKSILGRAQLIGASVQYIIVGNEMSKIIIETPLS